MIRLKVLHSPTQDEVDGIDLRRFVAGHIYEVGTNIGAVMLAEGWAEPATDDAPETLVPFSDEDRSMTRVIDKSTPPNLVRETYPPYADELAFAADLERRRRRRRTAK